MTGTIVSKTRSFLIRGAAVAAVVITYALGSVGTHILSVAGISTLAMTTTAGPADARRWFRRRIWRRRRRRW
jgi:hypothetical protein